MQTEKSYSPDLKDFPYNQAMDSVRELIVKLLDDKKITLKAASLGVGKNEAYMQQFIHRGSPVKLPEDVRLALAEILGVDESRLKVAIPSKRPPRAPPHHDRMGGPSPLRFTVPAYGQAIGGRDGEFVLNGNRIADILAPASLQGAPDAYAVFVAGDSMEPRYFAGEAVFVNPRLPVRRGDFVVAQIAADEGEPPLAYVKRYVSKDEKILKLEQLNPKRAILFPARQVTSIHRIIMGGDG